MTAELTETSTDTTATVMLTSPSMMKTTETKASSSSSSSSVPMSITPAKSLDVSSSATTTPSAANDSVAVNVAMSVTPPSPQPQPQPPLEETPSAYAFTDTYKLPPYVPPPQSELEVVETFVMNGIVSQHTTMTATTNNHNDDDDLGEDDTTTNSNTLGMNSYKAVIETLRRGDDPEMLFKVLIALRTAGHGSALRYIVSYPEIHAHLNHCIFRLNSVIVPSKFLEMPTTNEDGSTQTSSLLFEKQRKYYTTGQILDAHIHLLLAIVSARSISTIPALTWVWKMISYQPDEPIVYRLHALLFHLLRLIPKARTDIFPIIASCAPYWTRDKSHLDYYFLQCTRVIRYLPTIRTQILELIIDKSLEIDIHIKIQDDGNVHVEIEADNEGGEDEAGDQNIPKITTTVKTASTSQISYSEVTELSDKLDSLLALLLETIQKEPQDATCGDESTSEIVKRRRQRQVTRKLYYEIYPIFESTILTTHKAKFVQYCMFLLCGLEGSIQQQGVDEDGRHPTRAVANDNDHVPLYRDFTSKLLEIVMDPYRATLTRQSGACYLASFVSRAAYVSSETICESVSALLLWAETYISQARNIYSYRAADSREQTEMHSLFYTVCQAAFYIMCFRGTEAIEFMRRTADIDPNSPNTSDKVDVDNEKEAFFMEHVDIGKERWTRICNHPLRPLKFCLESVRSEFLHLAHFYDLIDEKVFDKLVAEAKRMSTGLLKKRKAVISTAATLEKKRKEGGVGGLGKGSNPLKSFFPFDPLLLSRSHAFVKPYYKHWQGPVEEEDVLDIEDDDDRSGAGEEGAEVEDYDGVFAMDEDGTVDDNEDEENSDGTDDEDGEEEGQDSHDALSDHEHKGLIDKPSNGVYSTPAKKEEQRSAWTEITKRKRTQSLGSAGGSW